MKNHAEAAGGGIDNSGGTVTMSGSMVRANDPDDLVGL
jgi:hypothetical protein